jgi:hypothetical protein
MKSLVRAAAAALLAAAMFVPAVAQSPDATIHIHGGSVGFIVGVGGSGGYINFQGKKYPISVTGFQVGTIGANSYDIDGEVFNLHKIADVEGTYAAGEAAATAVVGAGAIDMTNGNGVEIRARSSTAGLKLDLGASGVTIHLKH